MKPKIIIDKNIPFAKEVLDTYFEVEAIAGVDITSANLENASALCVRTRTKCDKVLLEGSSVKFIGTATIGFNHIDMEWCEEMGVSVKTAAGCNAGGVVSYVLRCLIEFEHTSSSVVGIIGVGNIGKLLDQRLRYFGFKTLLCDPFRAIEEGSSGFSSLEEVLKNSDVITVHTPLISEGENKTLALVDKEFFALCKDGVTFINSSRGEVLVDSDLVKALKQGKVARAAIDVWNNEPSIDINLLNVVDIATPHIAGYSIQGKANGTSMIVNAIGGFFNIQELKFWYPEGVEKRELFDGTWDEMKKVLIREYDIIKESRVFKDNIGEFENFRNEYSFRNEIL